MLTGAVMQRAITSPGIGSWFGHQPVAESLSCAVAPAGVFDGHGGDASVKWLASHFYDILCEAVSGKANGAGSLMSGADAAERALQAAFAKVDTLLLQHLTGARLGGQ